MYKGLKGETLYPPNSCPEAMHAVDDILELQSDFIGMYGNIVATFMDAYADRDKNMPIFLEEKFPKFCQAVCDKKKARGYHCPYLVTEHISVADLTLFAHFWKLMDNPVAAQDLAAGMKAVVAKYPEL